MIKVVGFIKRRKDITPEQFKDYWLTKHSKLEKESLKKNPTRKTVASFVIEPIFGKPDFDGMVELYYDSIEEVRSHFAGPQDSIMREDERNFVDPLASRVFVVTEEYVIGEKPVEFQQ